MNYFLKTTTSKVVIIAIISYAMIILFTGCKGRTVTIFADQGGQKCAICDHCTEKDRKVVSLEGTSNKEEIRSGKSETTYNLYNWYSTAVTGPNGSKAISLYGNDICALGGTVKGMIPDSLTWREVHDDVGGGAYKIDIEGGMASLIDARIHNVEDGYKPRETPYYSNLGTMNLRGAYMTKIRDDCIENDGFMPGHIEDCLFDGVFVFYSEQEQSRLPAPVVSISAEEDSFVYISNVLVRTDVTNAPGEVLHYNAGFWFKLMPKEKGAVLHKISIDNSVFAISAVPKNKYGNADWRRTSFPSDTKWSGENLILWLGEGQYGGEIPADVQFLEGAVAREKWDELSRKWVISHGYLPSHFKAKAGKNQVELEWSALDKVESYTVRRSTESGGPYTEVASNLKGNSYIDKELTQGKTYYYILGATDYCGVEKTTTEILATP